MSADIRGHRWDNETKLSPCNVKEECKSNKLVSKGQGECLQIEVLFP